MSLVWFSSAPFNESSDQTELDTIALIKKKTGVVIVRVDSTRVNIKFPDTEKKTIACWSMSSSIGVCFVDVENHFFAYGVPDGNAHNFSNPFSPWMYAMVYEIDGIIYDIPVGGNYRTYEIFNAPKDTNANTSKDSFCIFPAFSSFGYGVIKNLFINYDRFFDPGQKIIDDSGNVFVTLGGYFLYYNGKNK